MSQQTLQLKAQGGDPGAPAISLDGRGGVDLSESGVGAEGRFDPCREIDDLLERLSELAASDPSPEKFLEHVLHQAIRETEAIGGAIWAGCDCVLELYSGPGASAFGVASGSGGRRELLERVLGHGGSDSAIVGATTANGTTGRLISVIASFAADQNARGGIELLLPIEYSPMAQKNALHLAEAFAEIIGDYSTRRQVTDFRRREVHWQLLSRFVEAIHRPGLRDTAVAIANEGRWFSQCDRVSVLCRQNARCNTLAVSGIDCIEARSSVVTRLEELAASVLNTNEALWEVQPAKPRAPRLEELLHNYLEQSHSRALVALPLTCKPAAANDADRIAHTERESQPLGVIVLEWFASPAIDQCARERIELIARHSATALAVAHSTEQLPLIAVNRALAKVAWLGHARQLPRSLCIAGFLAAVLAALVIVPADFEIAADGELQPQQRREIFAPSDAVVDRVLVEHGDEVAAGQPLLHLRSTVLDFESARLRGEIQTAEKRLAAIRSERFERDSDQPSTRHRRLALSAEEEELKESLVSLRRQEQLIAEERDLLEVRSPFDGQVLTADVARSLAARPVERGQSLLSVGNVKGPWSLELRVPDEQIGYVLSAAEQARRDGVPLPVSFLLVGEPGVTYEGCVERVARRGQVDEQTGKTVVRVVARLDEAIENPRPGAGVVGKIHCGRRTLGFVWLHDAWNSVRRRLLF